MAIILSGTTGIDMGNTPVSNLANAGATDAVNKAYVDDLKIIATGTATFTAATNNISLTGIGIGVEIGDVIQISGAEDAKNNSEFTIEVITDANNIIVNQAHANKGTSKNLATRASDTGVTVKLLAKWYNASDGLGQGLVDMTSLRAIGTTYSNPTNRTINVYARVAVTGDSYFYENGNLISIHGATGVIENITHSMTISSGSTYSVENAGMLGNFWEKR